MKRPDFLLTLIAMLATPLASNAQGGQWAWLGGDTLHTLQSPPGNNGILGVPAPTNWPPDVQGAAYWTGSDGNLYLFGGERDSIFPYYMQHSDMWRFEPAAGLWTWMNGPGAINSVGQFGTQGVADPGNHPPAMKRAITWTTPDALWLFGGSGARAGAYAWNLAYDDLWKYELATQQWTWIKGSGTGNTEPAYGSLGVASNNNTPGTRWSSASWVGDGGNLWLYGGQSDAPQSLEDLWMYDPLSNMWTWMGGSIAPTNAPVWGTLNVANATNNPGQRSDAMGWVDPQGDLLLFGGFGNSPGWIDGFNDLWKYDSTSGFWTWINGENTAGSYGDYTGYCQTGQPAGRIYPGAWTSDGSGNAWMFGGAAPWWTLEHRQNDLWFYDGAANQWIWYSGSPYDVAELTRWPVYGQLGVASAANVPRSSVTAAMWLVGNALYLYGGYGYASNMNQLWRFDIDPSCATSVGLQHEEAALSDAIGILPNPASDIVRINGAQGAPWVVFDALGQRILTTTASTIDVSAWSEGIYFVKAEGRTQTIIIHH